MKLTKLKSCLDFSGHYKESKAFRQSIGLGDKRSMKWLENWAEKNKWQRVQRPEKKNAIFYSLNRKTAKLQNYDNMNKTGACYE